MRYCATCRTKRAGGTAERSAMSLWIVFAVMAALAVIMVLRPLMRSGRELPGRRAHEIAVYRDQLSEIDRDLARGLIDEAEADNARTEISRRLIAAGEREQARVPGTRPAGRRVVAAFVAVTVPASALGAYIVYGSPDLPASPFAAREAEPLHGQDLAALVGRVERHLQENPNDARGWDAVAPAYMRLRRFSDAADAITRAIRLGGETPARLSALGEARLFMTNGMVDAEARKAFERAVELAPGVAAPRYYLGLAALQDGDIEQARSRWRDLIATSPPDAPWVEEVRQQLAGLDGDAGVSAPDGQPAPPGPDAEDIAAAGAMTAEERSAMIQGMVDGLASRLEDDPHDLDGWLRLARAYVVLDRRDDASAAFARAREAFDGEAAALSRLDAAARDLGLVR